MTQKSLPLIVLLLLAATPAFAAPGPTTTDTPRPARQTGIMRYDTNKDGFVDRAEWDAGQDARFKELDANHDGKLTK